MPKVREQTKVLSLGLIGKSPHPSLAKRTNSQNNDNIDIAERLIRASTKVEFITLIKEAIEPPTFEIRDKEIFTALMELTMLPKSTLSVLKNSVAQRFRLRKAS